MRRGRSRCVVTSSGKGTHFICDGGWLCAAPPRPRASPLVDKAGAGGAAGPQISPPLTRGARREGRMGRPTRPRKNLHNGAAGVQAAGRRAGTGAQKAAGGRTRSGETAAGRGMQQKGRRGRPRGTWSAVQCSRPRHATKSLPQAAAQRAREWWVGPKVRSLELPDAIGVAGSSQNATADRTGSY